MPEMKAKRNESTPHPKESSGSAPAWIYAFAVFVLALLPRVADLGAIITPDERRWVERSVAFCKALAEGDWVNTFQTGHPGVTTMWTGTIALWVKHLWQQPSIGLVDYLGQVQTRPSPIPEYLAAARLPTAILTAVAVALTYLLVRRLLGDKPALLAAGLLALDPFYLAHSRVIHHDALASTFILLAVLTFVHYAWLGQSGHTWIWLVLSGVATALACLSKGSALFLLPFIGLVGLVAIWAGSRARPAQTREIVRQWIVALLLWGIVTAVVFVALWPAMWVDPIGTVGGMVGQAVQFAEEAHSKGNFFLGAPVEDPGFLFYPVVLLFRTTPVTLIGLGLFVVLLVRRLRRRQGRSLVGQPETMALLTLIGFVVLFTIFMSLGHKKFDRYLLPVFPFVDILAGVAFAQIVRRIASLRVRSTAIVGVLPVALLCLQGLASLPLHPYYLSAYNALAGGPWLAQRVLLVGWGEGLEKAAYYLNSEPDAENVRAATFYYRDIATFYHGKVAKLVDDKPGEPAPWLGSDYVVFYLNQVQREMPDTATVRYFQSLTPEFTYERNGLPYIQIYRTPTDVPAELRVQQEDGVSPDLEQ